ncbi:MAG: guanylate kinase [Bacteroidota bacterium]|nr:guanylate kinase [Bacteroidota bacterium]
MESGKIIILTAPSGSGKTTVAKFLLSKFPNISFSISATTRVPRAGEINGVNYLFINLEEFQKKIKNEEFFEYQEVYPNQYYGTLHAEIQRIWKDQKIALFDIDVKGAYGLERQKSENVLSIYIKASSIEVLRQRLIHRGTETPESIEKRILKATEELEYCKYFDYVITNDKLDLALKLIETIVLDFMAH